MPTIFFSFDIRYTYAVLLVNQDALSRSVIKKKHRQSAGLSD